MGAPLSAEVIATLDAALAHVKARGLTFLNFGLQDFRLSMVLESGDLQFASNDERCRAALPQ